jgi:hypothetical protein
LKIRVFSGMYFSFRISIILDIDSIIRHRSNRFIG